MHGARVIALRGNFDEALKLVRELVPAPPDRARQLRQPVPARGPEDRGVRDRSTSSASSTRCASRSATPATSPPTGRASRRWARAPRMFGFQAEGAAPLVHGAPVANPETVASAIRIGNPARWEEAMEAFTASRGARRAPSPTRRSSTPTASSPPTRACSASRPRPRRVAGLLTHGVDGAERVVCVLTGHGLKDPQTALAQAGAVVPCEPDIGGGREGRPGVNRRRHGPRPGVLGQPRAGVRRAGRRAGPAHGGRGGRDRAASPSTPTSRSPATAATCSCAASRRCTRPTTSSSRSAPTSRSPAGSGRARRRSSPASSRPTRSSSSAPTCWPRRRGSKGHPDNVAAALLGGFVLCARRPRGALRPAARPRGLLVVPAQARAHRQGARGAARRGSRSPTRSSTSPTPRCSCSASPAATSASSPAACGDRLHQPRRAHLYPRSWELVAGRERSARSARRSPAPARPCSSGATSRPPSAVAARLRRAAPRAGREVLRVPFAAAGAEVRAL